MKITIEIRTDNKAFDAIPVREVSDVLRVLSLRFAKMSAPSIFLFNGSDAVVCDRNGEPCGRVQIKERET